jgi:hypothetical protein
MVEKTAAFRQPRADDFRRWRVQPSGLRLNEHIVHEWRERIPARLQDGARRYRLEAARFTLPVGPVQGLAQV